MLTAYGLDDPGEDSSAFRLTCQDLVRRGWAVTVFYAATLPTNAGLPYELVESEVGGVHEIGVHNRQSTLFSWDHPQRDIGDPPVTSAFGAALDRCQPDVVHFQSLKGLGIELTDQALVRGIPGYFTAEDHWLLCPRSDLLDRRGKICPGPGDGARCASCNDKFDSISYRRRLALLKAHATSGLTRILACSDAVRETLLVNGYDDRLVDVVSLPAPHTVQSSEQFKPPSGFSAYVDELEAYYLGRRSDVRGAPPERVPAVRWQGDHGRPSSLSIINDAICSRLKLPLERISPNLRRVGPPAPYGIAVEVHHQWPPSLSPPVGGALAAIVPWESGSVPEQWVRQIQENVDELWVPSDFVRNMYVTDGVDPARVVTIPNGVDLELFKPPAPRERAHDGPVRFLFVGGLIFRKAPDLLLRAWLEAFEGRDDVVLTVKDFGADGVYARHNREPVRSHAASGALPRIEIIEDELNTDQMVALYQSADVLVHPYRAEGFGMPVLEAMACGLPVIVTAGGPTDEFCPPEAGWRISSRRSPLPPDKLPKLKTVRHPWILEPDSDSLIEALREAQADAAGRHARGAAGREAAQSYSWERVTDLYEQRIRMLAQRKSKARPSLQHQYPFKETARRRVLATPAWRGEDALPELLAAWSEHTRPGNGDCLFLLADPAISGTPAEIERTVVGAAQRGGADFERCADIEVLMESFSAARDEALLSGVDLYVPLHRACAGYTRLASSVGTPTAAVAGDGLQQLLAAPAAQTAAS